MRSTLSTFTKHTMGRVSAAHFDEAAFDYIGGAQLLPEMRGKGEDRQQFRQIVLQAANHGAVLPQTACPEAAKRRLCVGAAFGQIDRLCPRFDFVVVALHPRIYCRNRCRQSGTAIGDDQAELLAFEPAPIEVADQAPPSPSGSRPGCAC